MSDLNLDEIRARVVNGLVWRGGPDWAWAFQALIDRRELLDEVERLRAWKSEAMLVLDQWDEVYLALDRPWNLGESKAQGAQVAVEELLSTNRRLTAENERLLAAVQAVRDLPVWASVTTTEADVMVVRKADLDAALDGIDG